MGGIRYGACESDGREMVTNNVDLAPVALFMSLFLCFLWGVPWYLMDLSVTLGRLVTSGIVVGRM